VYDGEDILLEYDETNTLLARYTHGPGIDEPVAMTRGGANYFYHQDGLGSVTDLTDSTGLTARAYVYDAYGNILDQTGTVENPYTYTGREIDTETGLLHHRARYYDPTIGRFIQEDPIQFLGTDANFYLYTRNNPTSWVDLTGQKPKRPRPGGSKPPQQPANEEGVRAPPAERKAYDPRTGEVYDPRNPPLEPERKAGTVQEPPPPRLPKTPSPSCQKAYEKCLEFCVNRCPRPLKLPCVGGCLLLRLACFDIDSD
jgi:RHS repeat-associated protein